MNLPTALRKALAIVRNDKRSAYLQGPGDRYRLLPDAKPRGYTLHLSVRYCNAWQPWGEVDHFDVEDILNDKWNVARL